MSACKIAIDFDSAFTRIYKVGSGVVLAEPTVAAVSADGKGELKAAGENAAKLIGKTAENTKIVFPVFEGEIVNEKIATELLAYFLGKIGIKSKIFGAQAMVSVPCGATGEMLSKYERVCKSAGISKVYFAEAPILAALGQRLPLSESTPCFVVDMAGGNTNVAAVSLDGVIAGVSVNFGGNRITTNIIDYIAEVFGLQIGLLTAERIKKEIAGLESGDELSTVINGRDIGSGVPRSMTIKAMDLVEPVREYFDKVAEVATSLLKKLPPEVSAEVRHSGVFFSGESSSVYGLEKYYGDKFSIKVNLSEYPEMSVALGGGIAISDSEILKKISVKFN